MTEAKPLPIYHIEAKPHSGKPRIAGRGITVQFLATFVNDPEWTVERICQEYDVTLGQLYAAWSYYFDHKEAIDSQILADEEAYHADPEKAVRLSKLKQQYQAVES